VTVPPLLVAGSIALDTLDGPFGHVENELGGSALYFALAASLVGGVSLVAPVGRDAEAAVHEALEGRAIDLAGLAVVEAPTYRWQASQVAGRNRDLGSRDSIYDAWHPALPERYAGWAFVGSMRPDRQVEAALGLAEADLLAADAMRSYVAQQPEEARRLLDLSDWYFCNHEEFDALGGGDPEDFRVRHGLDGLCVKAGPEGVTACTAAGAVSVPALRSRPVVDTTGAGDALAGGMLAHWAAAGGAPDRLEEALVHGVACASIAIEQVGLRALREATPALLAERLEEVRAALAGQR
jgi:sugar/nucleoside kinase (ribokinase family)